MAELGYPKATVSNGFGLIAPKGTPPAVVAKLNEAFNKALTSSDIRKKITAPGNVAGGGTPKEFGAFIQAENKPALVKSTEIERE